MILMTLEVFLNHPRFLFMSDNNCNSVINNSQYPRIDNRARVYATEAIKFHPIMLLSLLPSSWDTKNY